MEQKQVELEQLRLNQEIIEKENQVDQLKLAQQKVQKTVGNLQQDLNRGYLELTHLNQEVLHFGGRINLLDQQEEQAHYFRSTLNRIEDDFNQQYVKEVKTVESDADALFQKRSELIWD